MQDVRRIKDIEDRIYNGTDESVKELLGSLNEIFKASYLFIPIVDSYLAGDITALELCECINKHKKEN